MEIWWIRFPLRCCLPFNEYEISFTKKRRAEKCFTFQCFPVYVCVCAPHLQPIQIQLFVHSYVFWKMPLFLRWCMQLPFLFWKFSVFFCWCCLKSEHFCGQFRKFKHFRTIWNWYTVTFGQDAWCLSDCIIAKHRIKILVFGIWIWDGNSINSPACKFVTILNLEKITISTFNVESGKLILLLYL